MKKTIIGAVLGLTVLSASAMSDTMVITKVQSEGGDTKASFSREHDGVVLMTGEYVFNGTPSLQSVVDKVAMKCFGGITVTATSTLGTSIAKDGSVETDAQLRANAWSKGGIGAYFIELARQLDLMK